MEEQNENIIVMTDENGEQVSFEFIDLIEYEDEEYVVLLPAEEADEEAGEVVILKLEGSDEENENYVTVNDEALLSEVFEIFKERHKDDFAFVD